MFVLLMLFLFKYIDDLIGKGFEWYIILELMLYASATNVAMALPLSVLLSSIMTYGSLGENYELVAIKSAGISLSRALYPMLIAVTVLSISAFVFSDYMLPIVNYKYFSLLYDVRQQKSSFLINEGVFNNSIEGYSIRVKRKDPDGQILYGLLIYEKTNKGATLNMSGPTNTTVTIAKQGLMYRTPDDKYLVLKLQDGVRYEETGGDNSYNPRQRLTRFRFKTTEQKFDLSGFAMKRTTEADWKSTTNMMNLKQLTIYSDSARRSLDKSLNNNLMMLMPYVKVFTFPKTKGPAKPYLPAKGTGIKPTELPNALAGALSEAESVKGVLQGVADRYKEEAKNLRRYSIEYQKKFTLSAACLALFLIGAPLGAIIRKGGLGLPVVVAVIFFLIYYIIATIGEKSAKEGGMSTVVGMWIAIVILTPIGLFLSYKAANDSVIFDTDVYKRWFQKLFKRKGTKKVIL